MQWIDYACNWSPSGTSRGRELFDLPDAPRPDATVAAPVRFLPEYDNLLLAHADRSRVIPERYRKRVSTSLGRPTFLVDGLVAGFWKISRGRRIATLQIEPLEALKKRHRAQLEREGIRLLRFTTADADRHEVQIGRAVIVLTPAATPCLTCK